VQNPKVWTSGHARFPSRFRSQKSETFDPMHILRVLRVLMYTRARCVIDSPVCLGRQIPLVTLLRRSQKRSFFRKSLSVWAEIESGWFSSLSGAITRSKKSSICGSV